VATRFGGIRKNLQEGHDALLVDPSDENEFADAMIRILTDEVLAAKLRANGLKTIRERFSWDSIANVTLDFYRRYV
jgi:glycosyltransferase involved in cell wall biosynthesis